MKLKLIVALLFFLTLAPLCYSQKYQLLIGSYTNAANPEGIHIYDFNSQTGELSLKSKTVIPGATYLAVSPNRKFVYSVSDGKPAPIAAFRFDPQSGLSLINKQSSGGDASVYVSVDASGKYVFAANSSSGSVAAIPIQPDGSLGSTIQIMRHEGSSVNKARQTKPMVHSVIVSPDNQYLFAQDLGTDKMNIYSFDPGKPNPLSIAEHPFVSVIPGSGPRHLTFSPNGKFAYLIAEMGGLIYAYNYKNGNLTQTQVLSVDTENFNGTIPVIDGHAADVHVTSDSKFLYAANRGEANEILIYSIDQTSGKLTKIGRQSTLGIRPRNMVIEPTENFVLAANQDSNDVFVFRRDQKTGLLTPVGKRLEIYRPACLKFIRVD